MSERIRKRRGMDPSKVADGKLRFMTYRLYRWYYGREGRRLFLRIGRDT